MKNIIIRFTIYLLFGLTSISSYSNDNQQQKFNEAELAQMLAPIALYPDSLLTHILIASTYPLEIVQAQRWLDKNEYSRPSIESNKWDPSIKALIPFPKIIDKLSEDLTWTQNLGDAFLQDETALLASIQTLRHKAEQAGNLSQMNNVNITQDNDNIVIKTIEREVVYVPYYDTRVVYGDWHWAHHPPVYWHHSNPHNYYQHNVFSWYPRVHISFNHFVTTFHWHNRHVIIRQKYPRNHHNITIIKPKRWYHNPKHRHNVAYRSVKVNQKYKTHRTSVSQNKVVKKLVNQRTYKKNVVINKHNSSYKANKRHIKKVTKANSKQVQVKRSKNRKVVKREKKQNYIAASNYKSSKVKVRKNMNHQTKSTKSKVKRSSHINKGKNRREHY